MKDKLSVRINSAPSAKRANGRRSQVAAYTLLASAASDVDSKKHKKNPFDARYVQLCLSDFADTGQVPTGQHSEATEGVSESLHVRVELIKSMKQSLMKQTATAMKSAQHHLGKSKQSSKQKASITSQLETESAGDTAQADHGTFLRPEAYANYLQLHTGETAHAEDMSNLQTQLSDKNPNMRSERELGYDIGKEANTPPLDKLIFELFGGQNPLHVDLDTLLQGPTITPSRQLPRSSGCNTLPTGSSSSIVQPRSAGPSASEDSACEQLRSIMLAFLKDAAQWDVWAGEDELMLEVQESPIALPSYIKPPTTVLPPASTTAQQSFHNSAAAATQQAHALALASPQPQAMDTEIHVPAVSSQQMLLSCQSGHQSHAMDPAEQASESDRDHTSPMQCGRQGHGTAMYASKPTGSPCLDNGQHPVLGIAAEGHTVSPQKHSSYAPDVDDESELAFSSIPMSIRKSGQQPAIAIHQASSVLQEMGSNALPQNSIITARQGHQGQTADLVIPLLMEDCQAASTTAVGKDGGAVAHADQHAQEGLVASGSRVAGAGRHDDFLQAAKSDLPEGAQQGMWPPQVSQDKDAAALHDTHTAQDEPDSSTCKPDTNAETSPIAEAQQSNPKLLVPRFKRRTQALPVSTAMTDEEDWAPQRMSDSPDRVQMYPGYGPDTAAEDIIEEEELHSGDNRSDVNGPTAQHRPSQRQANPKGVPGVIPMLKRRKAQSHVPSLAQSSRTLGAIPYSATLPIPANCPCNSSMLREASERLCVTDGSSMFNLEEEGEDEEEVENAADAQHSAAQHSAAAPQKFGRMTPATAVGDSEQDDPIEGEDEAPSSKTLQGPSQRQSQPPCRRHRPAQGRRRGVQETQEALILEPDFSDSNLASIQQGPLLGVGPRQKLCFRPVFDVETLLHPPPDPFNLGPSVQNKRRHKGSAAAGNAQEQQASRPEVALAIAIEPGMFSRSLLFGTDLVKLKTDRQAACSNYQPGAEGILEAQDDSGLAALDLMDDWDWDPLQQNPSITEAAAPNAEHTSHASHEKDAQQRADSDGVQNLRETAGAEQHRIAAHRADWTSGIRGNDQRVSSDAEDLQQQAGTQAERVPNLLLNCSAQPFISHAFDSGMQNSNPQHHGLQQDDRWQTHPDPEPSSGPVGMMISSPGCKMVFDIDSDPEGLPDPMPEYQQQEQQLTVEPLNEAMLPGHANEQHQNSEYQQQQHILNVHQRQAPDCYQQHSSHQQQQQQTLHHHQQQQQQQQQQSTVMHTPSALPAIEAIGGNTATEGCRLVFAIDSDPGDSATDQQQGKGLQHGNRQRQQDSRKEQGSASVLGFSPSKPTDDKGCRLVFDIDSDLEDPHEHQHQQQQQQQQNAQSHLGSDTINSESHAAGYLTGDMHHQPQLAASLPPPASNSLQEIQDNHGQADEDVRLSLMSHDRFHETETPGVSQYRQSTQTPSTVLLPLHDPQHSPIQSHHQMTAAGKLWHDSVAAPASSAVHLAMPMKGQEMNSHCQLATAEGPALPADGGSEEDAIPLTFAEEEQNNPILSGNQLTSAAIGLRRQDPATSVMLVTQQHSRQQLSCVPLGSPTKQSQTVELQKQDSSPLIFTIDSEEEEQHMADADHLDHGTASKQLPGGPAAESDWPKQPDWAEGPQMPSMPRPAPNSTTTSRHSHNTNGSHRPSHQQSSDMACQTTDQANGDGMGCTAEPHELSTEIGGLVSAAACPIIWNDQTALADTSSSAWQGNRPDDRAAACAADVGLQVHEAHNDQAPCDQVCSNSRPDGGQPAEAECPIIFDFPDDIECVEEEQDMWVQQEEVDEGVEIQQADSGCERIEPVIDNETDENLSSAQQHTQDNNAVMKKHRLRDELFQSLMKKALEQTAEKNVGLQPLVTQLSKAVHQKQKTPTNERPMTLASLKGACQANGESSVSQASTQKYFLALLILAQKLNTGQQGIAPKDGTDYVHSSTHHSRLSSVQMTLKSSTEAASHDDECAIPSTLKIAMSRCEGPE